MKKTSKRGSLSFEQSMLQGPLWGLNCALCSGRGRELAMRETRSLVSGYTTSNSKCAPNHAQRVCAEHRGAKTTDEQTQPNKHNRCD